MYRGSGGGDRDVALEKAEIATGQKEKKKEKHESLCTRKEKKIPTACPRIAY